MSATKILWGQLIAVFGVTLAGIWAATQWTARALAYQPELGEPWFSLGSWPIYPPPAFFWWWFAFDAYAPKIFETGALIAVSGAMAGIVIAIAMSVWRAREAKKAETYGSARWASEREVKKVKMFGDDGVVLGHFAQRYLRHDGPEHVLCFAPTRSGKGVGLVIPSLLTWPGSCIVHDINDERTAKRISDALGTATEMRAMKNYAGHRLSPWLGHLMVSRTETARPLLTPGEIIQLSPEEEIVMVGGVPPIRAMKARYFTDPRFTARLLPPPTPKPLDPKRRPKDDWSTLIPVNARPAPSSNLPAADDGGGKAEADDAAPQGTREGDQADPAADAANAGIRREPDLGEHEEIVPPAKEMSGQETPDEDNQDEDAARAKREAERTMRRNARNASLDPDDGIVL